MRAYLQLLRLPTVFTAMADIVLGYLLTHNSADPWRSFEPIDHFMGLLVASCALYLSGMVFNDVFDRKQDARERPTRPIPSGRVPLPAAVLLGSGLMLVGLGSAFAVGQPSLIVAAMLVPAILSYDAFLKRTPLGPLGMGLCRFLNVMLGASDYGWFFQLWARPQLVCAIGLGIYIVGVTWFARTEARASSRQHLLGALGLLDIGVAVLAAFVYLRPAEGSTLNTLLLMALVVGQLNYRASTAIRDPSPQNVQPIVKQMLLSYVMLDAALVYWHTGSGELAFATACLVIPAMLLARFIPMT